jgi:hypothetical protein
LGAFFLPEAGILAGMAAGASAGFKVGIWGGGLTAAILGTPPKVRSVEDNAIIALEACKEIIETKRINEKDNIDLIKKLINEIEKKNEEGKNLFQLGKEYEKSISIISEAVSKGDSNKAPAKRVAEDAKKLNNPNAYLNKLLLIEEICEEIINKSSGIESDFDKEATGGAVMKIRDYLKDVLQNIPIEAYSYPRFIDAIEALYKSITDCIDNHQDLKEESVKRLTEHGKQAVKEMSDNAEEELGQVIPFKGPAKRTGILTDNPEKYSKAAARKMVQLIKNS